MKEYDIFEDSSVDTVQILKEELSKKKANTTLKNIKDCDVFSEIYLFFDYDIHFPNKITDKSIEEQNKCVEEMLNYFNNETEKGKLYINYPMVESIRYFKKALPDNEYLYYTVDLNSEKSFKEQAHQDSFYKNLDFISFKIDKKTDTILNSEEQETINKNWEHIKNLSVKKANYICFSKDKTPITKAKINQLKIFENQVNKYVQPHQKIAILSAFPLFLFEYLKETD